MPVNRDEKQEISSVQRNLKRLKPPGIQHLVVVVVVVVGSGVGFIPLLDFKLISEENMTWKVFQQELSLTHKTLKLQNSHNAVDTDIVVFEFI